MLTLIKTTTGNNVNQLCYGVGRAAEDVVCRYGDAPFALFSIGDFKEENLD